MKRWSVFIASVVAFAAWCVFIFLMSNEPADESTELSMGVVWHIVGFIVPGYDQMSAAEQLYWQEALDHPVRKTAHFLEYALLGALALNVFWQGIRARSQDVRPRGSDAAKGGDERQDPRLVMAVSWATATLYATTDEFHQIFVPGRAGMITDVLLDSTGALVGVLLAALILRAIEKRRWNRDQGSVPG